MLLADNQLKGEPMNKPAPKKLLKKLNKHSHIKRENLILYKECTICGNKIIAELNIEGHIHHGSVLKCFDTKKCRRKKRNLKEPK